jgi:hypothetical protein
MIGIGLVLSCWALFLHFKETPVSLLADPLKKIGSVYFLYVYDCTRPLAPTLRQKMALSGV